MDTPHIIPTEGLVTVNPETAGQQTANYRNFIANQFSEIAFFIKTEDLLGALNIPMSDQQDPNISGVRVYMALEDATGPTHSHLYVVAVDTLGNDIILNEVTGKSVIYDMTQPCPDLCSISNILNGGDTNRR